MHRLLAFVGACLVIGVQAQRSSPCPDVFTYNPQGKDETDRWTGVITIKSQEELEGIWLHFSLDHNANVLLNWFGESTSKNNKDFSVRNLDYVVKPNQVLPVKIQVVYNEADKVPSLTKIRLNGKTICQAGRSGTPAPPVVTPSVVVPNKSPDFMEGGQGTTRRNQATPDFFPESVQCGTRIESGLTLITNGQPSEEGEWPWHIAIYKTGLQPMYVCGGSLVNRNYIVTAAHCVTKPKTKVVNDPSAFLVHLGRTYLEKYSPNYQERGLNKIMIHPNYDPMYFHNDLAVIRLSKEAELTDYVRPVCLWQDGVTSIVGKSGSVVGWGYDENHKISDILQEAQMPVVDTLTCIYSNTNFFSKVTSRTTFCAGSRNGTSVCNGDSGGGMFFPKTTSNNDTIWQLRGLVSISLVLQKRFCDPYNYVVFTDLAHFTDWINENTV